MPITLFDFPKTHYQGLVPILISLPQPETHPVLTGVTMNFYVLVPSSEMSKVTVCHRTTHSCFVAIDVIFQEKAHSLLNSPSPLVLISRFALPGGDYSVFPAS